MKVNKFLIINIIFMMLLLLANGSSITKISSIADDTTRLTSKIVTNNLYLQTSMKITSNNASKQDAAATEAPTEGEAAPAEAPAEGEATAPVEGETPAEGAPTAAPVDSVTQEELEESNARIKTLEDTMADQQQTVEQVRGLLDDVSTLSQQISSTKATNEEIKESVDDIKDYFNDLDLKVQTQGIETNHKLDQINNKLVKQLSTQLSLHLYSLNNVVQNILDDLKKLNRKIKQIKAIIPDQDSTCSRHTECGTCTTDSACGWCSLTQTCIPGTANGALDGSCSFFEYGKCSAPECSSLKSCSQCIKDATCGWCGNNVDPVCMKKDDGEKECNDDKFVHLWKKLNVCPTLLDDNKVSKLLKLIDKSEDKLKLSDPSDIRRKREELNIYEKEKTKKQADLKDLMKAVNMTQDQMKELLDEEQKGDIDEDVIEDNKESKNVH
jgi:hypothetical protein